jgi:membrane-associated phospholipid phosphatase
MDSSLFQSINRFADRTSWAHGIAKAYANNGIVLFAMGLLLSYLVARRAGDMRALAGSVWAGCAALVALGIGQIIGNAVDRARPYATLPNVHVLIARTTDFSFPSDHATTVGAVAVGLVLVARRGGAVVIAAALLMAFARVYVGAHYPLDVLAGLALGGAVAALGHVAVVPILARLGARLAASRLALLVTPRPAAR